MVKVSTLKYFSTIFSDDAAEREYLFKLFSYANYSCGIPILVDMSVISAAVMII